MHFQHDCVPCEASQAILQRLERLHNKKIDLSLGRMQRLLKTLGNPERRIAPVIHVAGTNGKGSTIAYMRAALEEAGKSVHVYTSPHLVRFHERIRLGVEGGRGRLVSERQLSEALRRCELANSGQPVTFFEITTAAAFLLFSEHPADFVLLEVGLGGLLDSTNVIDHPALSVITSISMDHEDLLGCSLQSIAAQKAGIIKAGSPVVSAAQDESVVSVLQGQAESVGAPLSLEGREFSVRRQAGQLIYSDDVGSLCLPPPRLPGPHQVHNACTAIAALRYLGLPLPLSAFTTAMSSVEWPGRLQRLRSQRLLSLAPEQSELWLDGGHNAAAGNVLRETLDSLAITDEKPLVLIVGMLASKDFESFLAAFRGIAEIIVAVPLAGGQTFRDPVELAEFGTSLGMASSTAVDVFTALESLRTRGPAAAPRILITGSLYLAGEVLEFGNEQVE